MEDTPPRKKNAASRFRSRRSKISPPLLDPEEDASTPPRARGQPDDYNPVTPEHPTLLNALEMAARPSPVRNNNNEGKEDSASAAPSPYTSSLEAMAAHVEASHISKERSSKKPPSSPKSPSLLKKRNSSGSSSSISSKSSRSNRKSSSAKAGRKAAPAPQNKVWLIVIPILLSFFVCECFLWLLVFRFSDGVATGEVVLVPKMAEVNISDLAPIISHEEMMVEDEGEEGEIDDSEIISGDDLDAAGVNNGASGISAQRGESDVEEPPEETDMDVEEPPEETGMDVEEPPEETTIESQDGEITRLQSMLEEGFARLRGSIVESDEESSRTLVESLCGNVWVIANEMLSSESPNSVGVGSIRDTEPVEPITLEKMSQIASNPWKSLALDAQHCLGGAGLAFLTKDVDSARLRVSTKVFDRLSFVQPNDPDVRAGLGTSLLFESIFRHENSDSNAKEADDDAHRSLLAATYHLKVASSLCSTPNPSSTEDGTEDIDVSEMNTAATSKKSTKDDDENSAANAAILHNLALAYIALGENESAVPILLRAASLRREHLIDTKLYWNAPHEVLQVAEEKALLIAAKTKQPEKKRKIPFLGIDFNVEEMVGI